jgi:lipopolysaccharide transport system permease protein
VIQPLDFAGHVDERRAGAFAALSIPWRQWRLVSRLAWREIEGRYRGARMGMLWPIVHPLILLALYTFVFGAIFQVKWSAPPGGHAEFATMVFAGLVVHGFFAECMARAPAIVLANPSYVKRVVFPLEVLAWVTVLAASFHAALNFLVLLCFVAIGAGTVPMTILLLPLVLLPLLLLTLGATWLVAALGVYLRDIGQVMGLVVTVLLFLSPVFYPVSAVPLPYRELIAWNPLTPVIEMVRAVAIVGTTPDWLVWAAVMLAGLVAAVAGFHVFQRARPGFADVL